MPGTDELSAEDVASWLRTVATAIHDRRDELNALDAAIGDADHGTNLDRGMSAVVAALPSVAGKDLGAIFKRTGMTLVSTVGGASGPLYGTLFLQLGSMTTGKATLTAKEWSLALRAGVDGVSSRGHAVPNDKTMLDALLPAADALAAAIGEDCELSVALARSAYAAEAGSVATIPLVARKGRASYLGERSAGHQDPGATSAALIMRALSAIW
jgi:dihydroxyacetone kinase-like protein